MPTNSASHHAVWKQWGLASKKVVFHWILLMVHVSILEVGWGQKEIQFTHTFSQWVRVHAFWFCLGSITGRRSHPPHLLLTEGWEQKVSCPRCYSSSLWTAESPQQESPEDIHRAGSKCTRDTYWRIKFLVNNFSANLSQCEQWFQRVNISCCSCSYMVAGTTDNITVYQLQHCISLGCFSDVWYKRNPEGRSGARGRCFSKPTSANLALTDCLWQQKAALYSVVHLNLQKLVQIMQ